MADRRWSYTTPNPHQTPVSIEVGGDAEVLEQIGARRADAVRAYVKGFGWCWVIPDPLGPRPEGLRRQVWIVEDAAE